MLDCIAQWLAPFLPEGFNPLDMAPTLAFVIIVVFILGLLIHFMADKAARYNHALASAMAILFSYIVIMMWSDVLPDMAKQILDILPLIDVKDGTVTLFAFKMENFAAFFREFLYAFILSFILIGLDDLIPDARNALAWILLQLFITAIAMILYWFVIKAINHFMPELIDSYAPLVLGCILLFMILLGVLKIIIGLLVVAVNPLLIAVSTFFGSSPVGKALGKSVMCALILCAVAFFLHQSEYRTFALADLNLLVCGLPMLVLLGLWFLVGCILL